MKSLIIAVSLLFVLIACEDPAVIVAPEACLQNDSSVVKVNGRVTFTDCSENALGTWLHIYPPGQKSLSDSFRVFNALHRYRHKFTEAGEFIAVLTATGDTGAPIDTAFVNVTVLP